VKPLSACRVFVSANSFGKFNPALKTELEDLVGEVVYNRTGKPLTSDQVRQTLPGMDGFIAGLDQIDEHALQEADSLKVIARYGVGVDQVDLKTATEKGIIVSNTPGANSASVAELALVMLLMLARQIPTATDALRQGEWPRLPGLTLEGKTIGIMGLGAIGKHFAKRLAGFDCQIIAYDPYADAEFASQHDISLVSQKELISQADFLSLHLPLLPETRNLVDEAFIQSMKKGSFLINTSRGELIDETALVAGLASGHIQGAGLDAFIKEPPDPDNPLLTFPQVVCTPHLGAQTDGATNNMGRMALDECIRVLRGEEPLYQVN